MDISVVIPVYGCRECLHALHERLTKVLEQVTGTYEIVYVDDRSPDESWARLTEIADTDAHAHAVRLSRNFGQHAAITAGLSRARGDRVVVMDCDLQDAPEDIPRLCAKADEGFDVVFARRRQRHHSRFRRLAAKAYFAVLRVFGGTNLEGEYGTFSLISRKVVDAFLELRDADRHYLFIVNWLGFETTAIDVEHRARAAGRSSYTFSRLVQHAFDGIVFQTTKLLRWIVYAGFVIAMAGLGLAAFFVYSWAVNKPYPGWTSLAVLLLVLGGFTILSLGVTGLYVGKIFGQVKQRPIFIVDEERPAAVSSSESPGVERSALRSV